MNDCEKCEELLQPWLDRELTEVHLDVCAYCRRRYRFEEDLRRFVRQAADAPMPVELRQRLASLRISL